MMETKDLATHKRYYIFRHQNGERIRYRTSTGDWTDYFEFAGLWSDHDAVTTKANVIAHNLSQLSVEYTIVIGSVYVTVDGIFPLEVISL